MRTILLIIKREYLTRVQKKSFIVMTILGPLLIAAMYGGVIYLAVKGDDFSDEKRIAVLSENTILSERIEETSSLKFDYVNMSLDELKSSYENGGYDYLVHIPEFTVNEPKGITIYGKRQANRSLIRHIEKNIERQIEAERLMEQGINKEILKNLKVNIDVSTVKLTDEGEKSGSTEAAMGVGFFAGILIYFFIFLYGVQVMRGVIEEKTIFVKGRKGAT